MQWISTVYIKAMIIEGREDEMGHPFDDEDSEDDSDGEMDKQPFSIDVNYNSLLAANSDIPNAEKVGQTKATFKLQVEALTLPPLRIARFERRVPGLNSRPRSGASSSSTSHPTW